MPDREKVIKGLEFTKAMITFNPSTGKDIEPGSLNDENKISYDACVGAIALLKEQEARVMTLEEVKGMKRLTICAVEQRSKVIKNTFNAEYGGIVTLGDKDFLDFGLYADTNRYRRTEAGYGKSWRCWTSRPTDKQRQEVKWDD